MSMTYELSYVPAIVDKSPITAAHLRDDCSSAIKSASRPNREVTKKEMHHRSVRMCDGDKTVAARRDCYLGRRVLVCDVHFALRI